MLFRSKGTSSRSYAAVARPTVEEIAKKRSGQAIIMVEVLNKQEPVKLNKKAQINHIWTAYIMELMNGDMNDIPIMQWLDIEDGLGKVCVNAEYEKKVCQHLNKLKVKVSEETAYSLRTYSFKQAEKDIRLQFWAPFWQTPTDKNDNKKAADHGIKCMAKLNNIPGEWSQAKVTCSATRGVYFNWEPDSTMLSTIEKMVDKETGKITIQFPSWKYLIEIKKVDINEIRNKKAKAKLEKAQMASDLANAVVSLGDLTVEATSKAPSVTGDEMEIINSAENTGQCTYQFVKDILPEELFTLVGPLPDKKDDQNTLLAKEQERNARTELTVEEAEAITNAWNAWPSAVRKNYQWKGGQLEACNALVNAPFGNKEQK